MMRPLWQSSSAALEEVESASTMRRTVEALGAQIAKTYRVYEKLL